MAVDEGIAVGVCVGRSIEVGNNVTLGAGGSAVGVTTTGAETQANIKVGDSKSIEACFVFMIYYIWIIQSGTPFGFSCYKEFNRHNSKIHRIIPCNSLLDWTGEQLSTDLRATIGLFEAKVLHL